MYQQILLSLQKVLADPVRPLCSHYGAVVGLHALGWKVRGAPGGLGGSQGGPEGSKGGLGEAPEGFEGLEEKPGGLGGSWGGSQGVLQGRGGVVGVLGES